MTHRNGRGPDRGERLGNEKLYAFKVAAVNERGRSYYSNADWARVEGGADVDNGGQQAPPEEEALTASLESAPERHDGEDAFRVRIAFSTDIETSYKDLDDGFAVTGGAITSVRRVDRRSDLWEFKVAPSGDGDVILTLAGGRACSVTGAPARKTGARSRRRSP